MKRVYVAVILLVLSLLLPSAIYAQEQRHSPHGEIQVFNDTDTQVSVYVSTQQYGKVRWTYMAGTRGYVSRDGIRLRVSGNDEIEIGDWGKALVRDLGKFRDGVWEISIRHARHELRSVSSAAKVDFPMEENTDLFGSDYRDLDLSEPRPELCWDECLNDPRCKAYTYVKPGVQGKQARCWLKNRVPQRSENSCCVSGVK